MACSGEVPVPRWHVKRVSADTAHVNEGKTSSHYFPPRRRLPPASLSPGRGSLKPQCRCPSPSRTLCDPGSSVRLLSSPASPLYSSETRHKDSFALERTSSAEINLSSLFGIGSGRSSLLEAGRGGVSVWIAQSSTSSPQA